MLYKPPEQMISAYNYTKNADIWAIGIICFELLTGYHPLHKKGEDMTEFEMRLENYEKFDFPETMSLEARDFIEKLCDSVPNRRFKARSALKHNFITRELD